MENYLEKLCINLGIKIIYANNKVLLLSCDIKNNIPIIRVHKIFKKCSQDVAAAVLGYYTDGKRLQEHEKVIRSFLENNFTVDHYKIMSPKEMFRSSIISNMTLKSNTEKEQSLLVELEIYSMTLIEDSGVEKSMSLGDSLRPLEDDLLEMNIIVTQPST